MQCDLAEVLVPIDQQDDSPQPKSSQLKLVSELNILLGMCVLRRQSENRVSACKEFAQLENLPVEVESVEE